MNIYFHFKSLYAPVSWLMKNKDHSQLNWYNVSWNTNITTEFVLNTLDKPWYWSILSANPSITPELVLETQDKPWVYGLNGLSSNPSITHELILSTLSKPWSRRVVPHSKVRNVYVQKLSDCVFDLRDKLTDKEYMEIYTLLGRIRDGC